MDTFPNIPIEDEVFSMEDIEFGVNQLIDRKDKSIEGYQH
jgi:hypothetical protein